MKRVSYLEKQIEKIVRHVFGIFNIKVVDMKVIFPENETFTREMVPNGHIYCVTLVCFINWIFFEYKVSKLMSLLMSLLSYFST